MQSQETNFQFIKKAQSKDVLLFSKWKGTLEHRSIQNWQIFSHRDKKYPTVVRRNNFLRDVGKPYGSRTNGNSLKASSNNYFYLNDDICDLKLNGYQPFSGIYKSKSDVFYANHNHHENFDDFLNERINKRVSDAYNKSEHYFPYNPKLNVLTQNDDSANDHTDEATTERDFSKKDFSANDHTDNLTTEKDFLVNDHTADKRDIETDYETDGPTTRTIVVTSGKGGVGKTTTTANLGMSIAKLGYNIVLIDADIGLRNLDLLLGLENRVFYTAMDIFDGACRLDQALVRDKRLKNLCLLAISKNRQRYNVTRQKMEELVASIGALGYDFIVIDCPAGIDVGFINAISPAQEAVIVTTPEITSMRDADRVAGLLEANGIYNAKLLINRVRPDMIQRSDMMSIQDVQELLGIPLLGAIPEDVNVIVSTNRGEPLVLQNKLTLSGIAFENAARRLIGNLEYSIDMKTPYKGLFDRIRKVFRF